MEDVIADSLKWYTLVSFSPERVCVTNGLGATQFGVQVVVGASHLAHSYPVLALERQPQGPPAQVGRHV